MAIWFVLKEMFNATIDVPSILTMIITSILFGMVDFALAFHIIATSYFFNDRRHVRVQWFATPVYNMQVLRLAPVQVITK